MGSIASGAILVDLPGLEPGSIAAKMCPSSPLPFLQGDYSGDRQAQNRWVGANPTSC
jgi:hypothetical protein